MRAGVQSRQPVHLFMHDVAQGIEVHLNTGGAVSSKGHSTMYLHIL